MEPSIIVVALIAVALATIGITVALQSAPPPPLPDKVEEQKYCPNCGMVGVPQFRKSGSTGVEVLLWLFMLLPGIIYSIWRASTKRWVCPKCEQTGMIPLDSPKAKAAIRA